MEGFCSAEDVGIYLNIDLGHKFLVLNPKI